MKKEQYLWSSNHNEPVKAKVEPKKVVPKPVKKENTVEERAKSIEIKKIRFLPNQNDLKRLANKVINVELDKTRDKKVIPTVDERGHWEDFWGDELNNALK